MTGTPTQLHGASGPSGYRITGVSNTGRAYVVTGATPPNSATVSTPTAGGDIDGVTVETTAYLAGLPACKGYPVQVEPGGSVTAGDDLEVQGDGQFVTASGGTVVARALEGASAGNTFWAVFR